MKQIMMAIGVILTSILLMGCDLASQYQVRQFHLKGGEVLRIVYHGYVDRNGAVFISHGASTWRCIGNVSYTTGEAATNSELRMTKDERWLVYVNDPAGSWAYELSSKRFILKVGPGSDSDFDPVISKAGGVGRIVVSAPDLAEERRDIRLSLQKIDALLELENGQEVVF